MRRNAFLISAVSLLVVAAPSAAQNPAAADIDEIFASFRSTDPGCAVGVAQNGALVLQRGYGSANLDYGLPHGPEMVYYVGSVSKQFTAATIALLATQKRLSLDDDVRRYIPELPDYGDVITIRHLVHHTSGLRDIYTLMAIAGIRMQDVLTDEEALSLIAGQKELNFKPGDDYLYSNSGYWLLGQIVERITGQTLREYADSAMFRPLGMTNTHFHDEPDHVLRNRVVSYGGSAENGYRITYISNFDKVGAGGLYTTLGDLARWDANFYSGALGGAEFLKLMLTRGILNNGDTLVYAFGNNIQQRSGRDIVRHAGTLMGFKADLVRYPKERLTVMTLCNLSSINPGALADRVADLYLTRAATARPAPAPRPAPTPAPARTPAPSPAARTAPASPQTLQQFAGTYHSNEVGATYVITADAEGLALARRLNSGRLRADDQLDTFSIGSHVLTFQRDGAGRVTSFTVQAGRVRNIRFQRVS